MSSDKFLNFEQGRLFAWEGEIGASLKSAGLQSRNDWNIRCYDSVSSTMDVSRDLVSKLMPTQSGLVLAKNQSKGRGRQGRPWNEAAEGFYGTFCFQSQDFNEKFYCLPLVTGLVVANALENLGCITHIKWPNDLLTKSGLKLGGILIEYVKESQTNAFLVGIGINILGEPGVEKNSASLFTETGRKYSAPFIATFLAIDLSAAFLEVQKNGFLSFRQGWLNRTRGIDENLSVHVGSEIVSGIFKGVSPLGYLLLEVNGSIREISSGELVTERS